MGTVLIYQNMWTEIIKIMNRFVLCFFTSRHFPKHCFGMLHLTKIASLRDRWVIFLENVTIIYTQTPQLMWHLITIWAFITPNRAKISTCFAIINDYSIHYYDDDQWHYSPNRALASLTGFIIVYSTMWGYQLHNRPVLDTLIQPSETSSSNYQRLSWRSR
jgi:hypothetical protein